MFIELLFNITSPIRVNSYLSIFQKALLALIVFALLFRSYNLTFPSNLISLLLLNRLDFNDLII